ncbi:MAG: 30S ribosomal protein S6 [Candidatus Omnitrophota bacterium]|nr:30S ribosomal protein S6 [Candidatus Omnitrophota bacterium]
MNKYEIMIITRVDLKETEKEELFKQFQDTIIKNSGQIINQQAWLSKSRLTFPIKRQREGLYYLIQFNIIPNAIQKLKQTFRLNEAVLRIMITKVK